MKRLTVNVDMDKTILHCDLNGFFASVECVLNPELKKVPMAVGGNAENRHGVILAKNELAKKCRVKTAETIWEARKKCPDLVIVPPHHDEYVKYSKLVNQIYEEYTDLVEAFGIDESWLDVTGSEQLFGDGRTIADTIRERVKKELGLTVSVGVSFNKIFAKLGSDYKKPDATTVISRENYKEMVFPLPVGDLLYVGDETIKKLKSFYIHTIGQLANENRELLIKAFGKMGGVIWDFANGICDDPVKLADYKSELKSIGNGITFKKDLVCYEEVKAGVQILADEIAMRMRKHAQRCTVISVLIKDYKFKTIQRQKTLTKPTNLTSDIIKVSLELIEKNWDYKTPIRMLTITGKNLTKELYAEQLSFFEKPDISDEKNEKVEQTIFEVRNRYGHKSISLGAKTKTDIL